MPKPKLRIEYNRAHIIPMFCATLAENKDLLDSQKITAMVKILHSGCQRARWVPISLSMKKMLHSKVG